MGAVEKSFGADSGISWWYLGLTKIESGDESGYQDLEKSLKVENSYSPGEQDYLRLIKYYLKANDFSKIAGIYESLISLNPSNPQYYASLAIAYAKLGRLDDAANMARQAVKLDASFGPEAKIFLKSIGREL